jgi:hypothetical protein
MGDGPWPIWSSCRVPRRAGLAAERLGNALAGAGGLVTRHLHDREGASLHPLPAFLVLVPAHGRSSSVGGVTGGCRLRGGWPSWWLEDHQRGSEGWQDALSADPSEVTVRRSPRRPSLSTHESAYGASWGL